MLAGLWGVQSAGAADKLISNFSFENGLTGWSTWGGTSGQSSSTTQKHSGTSSAKITDNVTTTQYGLESAKIAISSNTIYMVYGWAYIQSGTADLSIRFYDSSQNYISSTVASKNSPTNEWTYLKAKATSPSNAAYATALVSSSAANTGTAYWDDIYLTSAFTDLGEQVFGEAQLHSAVFGVDGSGNGVIYAVADGSTSNPTGVPAKMTIVDYNNNTVVTSKPLNGSGVAWAAIRATDNKIYMGTPNTGRLYQYTPGAANVVDLGVALSGQNHIYALAAGAGGKVFGGTAPNAKFFKWDSTNGFFEIQASNPVAAGETYVRSMAYDIANNRTYLGTGTDGRLMYFDNDTGNRYNILPSAYSGETWVYSLDYTGGKVFAQLKESNKMIVLNVVHNTGAAPTVTLDKEISAVHSLGVSNAVNNKVYYTADSILHEYDIVAKITTSLGFNLGTNVAADIGVVQLTDQTNWPGYTVVTLGYVSGEMKLFKYNIQTGATSTTVLDFPDTSTSIRSMTEGPDGKIYTAGYLTGGLGVYSPIRGDLDETKFGFGQAENMITYNDKLYQGVYPGARIYDYDPITGVKNQLFELSGDEQDRPFGLAAGDGKLFVGTVPGYGHLGGALTVYDIATGAVNTIRNIVNDQAVIALAYYNGYVYGGTSIWGGNGSTPTTSQAKFFRYNVATGAVNTYTLPGVGSSEIQAITSVSLDSNNKIMFWAEGYLMKYDPSTNTVTNKGQKFPINYTVGQQSFVFFDGHMLIGKWGDLYGSIGGNLFVIDSATDAVSTISTPVNASGIAQDEFGNLYFKNADNLWRYAF
ncbi:carbohydrate binding domain-containing protein [Paenibacillus qinlingensis]|uniref:CBM-cenC domain-containing protein n=1 Tax=Paenibacillus qinlingensis TaxID=1837343 RepID=A0ABU1NWP8_9BACL|nr:carbohydrate binding domain-containing protein [Paenibacillus qinlingensis]MDR6551904.1 hypothetical protein [Paenibacillus qinlingensis]